MDFHMEMIRRSARARTLCVVFIAIFAAVVIRRM